MTETITHLNLDNSTTHVITTLDDSTFQIKYEEKVQLVQLQESTEVRFVRETEPNTRFVKREEQELRFVKETEKGDPGSSAYQVAVANGFAGTVEEWLNSLKEVSNSRYDFSAYFQGSVFANEELYRFICVTPFRFLPNLTGSLATAKTKPLQNFYFLLLKNNVQFGTILFQNTSSYGLFSGPEVLFQPEDVFQIVADNIIDPNLTNVAITIAAYRQIYGG